MRVTTLIMAIAVVAVVAAPSFAASKRKDVRQGPGQIACTRAGCIPVPPGCYGKMTYTWDGYPTGFEAIVCPRRR
jgi:hypothetical protein